MSTDATMASREIVEKRRLNSRALISRLPPEILSLIFFIVRDVRIAALREGFKIPFNDVGSELWKDLTHVCHLWREIAIGTPTLWTRLVSSPDNHKWTQEMLMRSRRCLLTTIIVGSLDSCESAQIGRTELIKQLDRCRSISIRDVPVHDIHKHWSSKVDAPRLEFLFLEVSYEEDSSKNPFILSDAHLQAPLLRSLGLENCGVDWKSGFLSSRLTRLGLDALPVDSLLQYSDLIKVLANMPFLEELHLGCPYVRDGGRDIPLQPCIPTCVWPHLQRLEIVDDRVIDIARFLNNCTFPLTSKLYLKTYERMHEAAPHIPLIMERILDHFPDQPDGDGVTPPNCMRSFMVRELVDMLVIKGYNEVLHQEQGIPEVAALLVFNFLEFESEDWSFCGRTFVNGILPQLPLNSIVFLDVYLEDFYLSMACWLEVFGSIPTLEVIRVGTPRPMAFFHAIHPDSGNGKYLPFPALKSIGSSSCRIANDFPIVAKILHDRMRFGMQLQELVFFVGHCAPAYPAVSLLMNVVPKVRLIRTNN